MIVLSGDLDSPVRPIAAARAPTTGCGPRVSIFMFDRMHGFVETTGKQLLVLLSYSAQDVIDAIHGKPRFDQSFVDYLAREGILFVDMLEKHVADFRSFRCSPEEYVERYYIGHYSPSGNHFFAYAVKDEPVAYLKGGPALHRLAGALA